MKTTKQILVAVGVMIAAALAATSALGQMSINNEDDISALMSISEKQFDMKQQDAVILLDDQSYIWTGDGRLINTVHRIIWIGTSVGIEEFGDHRIPYDHANCSFDVATVRTWRGMEFWETGETGIVETLPSRLRAAYDYSNMREMMLLHDGIEIPCILEVKYSIEDKQPYRRGAEGMWLFAKEYPVMKSKFSITIPIGRQPVYVASDDVPEPDIIMPDNYSHATYTWTMGPLEALPVPHTDDPAEYTPHLIWSTWNNWTAFGDYLGVAMKTAQTLDSGLIGALDSLLVDARTGPEKAELIADFIEQRVAYIDYPEKYWRTSPRPAIRTYQTAYGHRLDRAILAAAMFEQAGLTAIPVFIGKGFNGGNTAVPSLGRYGGIGVWVSGPDVEAYYDPAEDLLRRGLTYIVGRTLWSPGTEDEPGLRIKGTNENSRMEIIIDMTIDTASDTISGHGFLMADNCLNVFDQMEGLSDEAKVFLESSMSSLIDGIEITDFSFSRFDLFNVTCGYDFNMKKPDDDDYGRLALEIGDPEGGLFEHLPEDINLYESKRFSPINLQCLMQQEIVLKFRLKGLEAAYLPSAQQIENKAGRFSLTVDNGEQLIAVNRELSFPAATYEANIWPDLRALLLADSHRKNRTILFKKAENSAE